MSLSKLNATCELINSIRSSILQDEQRSVNESKDGTKPPSVKRQFTQPELSQIGSCVAELAGSAPEIASLIGAIASDFIPLDHRGVSVYDYVGCALFHARRHADALLVWHQAARAEAADGSSSSSISTSEMPLRPRVGRRTKGSSNGEESKTKTSSIEETQTEGDAKSKGVSGEDAKSKTTPTEEAKSKALEEVRKKLSETHRSLTHIRENMFHALGSIVVPPIVSSDLKTLNDVMGGEVQKTSWHASAIPAPYHISNPCIITHPTDRQKKFLVVLRAVNYTMTDKHQYVFPHGHSGVDTMNFVTDIDADWSGKEFGRAPRMVTLGSPVAFPNKTVKNGICGQEDIRLAWDPAARQMWATFTSLEMTENRKPGICVAKFDYKKGRLTDIVRLFPGLEGREKELDKIEKNWIPFVFGGELYCIYSFWPICVLKPDTTTGECKLVSLDACMEANKWRGSSPLCELSPTLIDLVPEARSRTRVGDKWYLAVVHTSDFPRYTHQFVVIRIRPSSHSEFRPFSLQVLATSPPFIFEAPHDVEFTCGLAITPDGSEIVIPNSRRDEHTFCSRFASSRLFSSLIPCDSPDDFSFA